MQLRLLARPDCGLCEELIEALQAEFPGVAWQLEVLDVDSRPEWQRRYGLRIPVLLDADGSVLSAGRLDAATVADWLAAQSSGVAGG